MLDALYSLIMDPEAKQKLDFLARVPLFGDLTRAELAKLQPWMSEHVYRRGEVIFEEGDIGRALVIVRSGKIEVYKTVPRTGRTHLRFIEGGGYLGEMSLLQPLPRSASAAAAEESEVYLLDKSKLESLMESSHTIAMRLLGKFARILSERFRSLEDGMLAGSAGTEDGPSSPAVAGDAGDRVAELERIIGRMTVEIERLKSAGAK